MQRLSVVLNCGEQRYECGEQRYEDCCNQPYCVCSCLQLRINLNEGRVAQIMGRGPYRVWFKGIDYPGGSCW